MCYEFTTQIPYESHENCVGMPADFAGDIIVRNVVAVFAFLCFEPAAVVDDHERSLFILFLSTVILCYYFFSYNEGE